MSPRARRHVTVAVCVAALSAVLANSAVQWKAAAPFGWSGLDLRFESQFTDREPRQRSVLRIHRVEPRSPASAAGLRAGDRIVGFDGSPDRLVARIRPLRGGDTALLEVERDAVHTVRLHLISPWDVARVPLTVALQLLLGFAALLVGGFVLARRGTDDRALLLFVLMSLYAIVRFAEAGPVHRYGIESGANFVQLLAWVAAGLFFFPVLLHFFLVFPARRPIVEAHPRILRQIYLPSAAMTTAVGSFLVLVVLVAPPDSRRLSDLASAVRTLWPVLARAEAYVAMCVLAATAAMLVRAVRRRQTAGALAPLPGLTILGLLAAATVGRLTNLAAPQGAWLNVVSLILLGLAVIVLPLFVVCVAFPLAACVAFWRSYRESGSDGRRQLRWPLLGLLLAVAGYLLTVPLVALVSWMAGVPGDSPAAVAARFLEEHGDGLALLLVPLSIAFAVLRYRLLDIDLYIRNTIIYGGITGILGIAFAALVGGLGGLIGQQLALGTAWSPAAATLIVGALFLPVRARVQRAVDSRFYRQRDYPGALALVAARLSEAPAGDAALRAVLDHVQEAIPARTASLWLRSLEAPVCELRACSGGVGQGSTIPAADAETILRSRGEYPVPVSRDGVQFGYLSVGAKLADTPWDEQDANFLQAAAGQIAAAVTGPGSLADRYESERAAEIQRALLPSAIPTLQGVAIAGFSQPARVVGGDYYDVIRLAGARLGLAIADVSGKGVAAALLMSNVQASLRLLAPTADSPASLCGRLNELMCANVTPGRFVTFFYAELDSAAGEVVYCNAGHNEPILMRADGAVLRLSAGGLPLGILGSSRYEEGRIGLAAGDRLLLFTDGVCDAADATGTEFGEDHLIELFGGLHSCDAAILRDAVYRAVAAHCDAVFSDDFTLLVVSYLGRPQAAHQ